MHSGLLHADHTERRELVKNCPEPIDLKKKSPSTRDSDAAHGENHIARLKLTVPPLSDHLIPFFVVMGAG